MLQTTLVVSDSILVKDKRYNLIAVKPVSVSWFVCYL